MKRFIDAHRDARGVEPIWRVPPITPSTYYAHAARKADPDLRSAAAKADEALMPVVRRMWDDKIQVYDVCEVCRQMRRKQFTLARCTVQRLMNARSFEARPY